jgi:hypothetical protein
MRRIMKPTLKGVLALLLPGICAMAIGQAPPDGEQAAEAAAVGQNVPCVPAAEVPKASEGQSGPLKKVSEDAPAAPEPCEEEVPDATLGAETTLEDVPGDSASGIEADKQQTTGAEVAGDEVFKPVDEISEDYPVPLPSDI